MLDPAYSTGFPGTAFATDTQTGMTESELARSARKVGQSTARIPKTHEANLNISPSVRESL